MASNIEFVNYKEFVEGLSSVDSAESTDKSVVCNPVGGPRKFDAFQQNKLKFFVVTDDPEYLYAILDSNDVLLFAIKKDGDIVFGCGVPDGIKIALEKMDRSVRLALNGKVDAVSGKSLIISSFAAAQNEENFEGVSYGMKAGDGGVIFYVGTDGKIHFNGSVEFGDVELSSKALEHIGAALHNLRFNKEFNDFSGGKSVIIPQIPKVAFLDISGIGNMPVTKKDNKIGVARFWDNNGNYFSKKVVVNAQGNSSLSFLKKNVAIDFYNDDDNAFSIKFGSWVAQDSYHLKACYTDFFRGTASVAYAIYKEIAELNPFDKNRTWKRALVDFENQKFYNTYSEKTVSERNDFGALCHPMSFPCVVFLQGEFYGLFSFQLKKHRDNYKMKKDVAENIHLDGRIDNSTLFGGSIDWTAFEVRNPKNLYYKNAKTVGGVSTYVYDGDYPDELVDSETAEAWISAGTLPDGTAVSSKVAKNLRLTAKVRSYIVSLSGAVAYIEGGASDAEKEQRACELFDLDNFVDYIVFSDFINNFDGFNKNWQWTTWDGVKWFVNPYDLDEAFGATAQGEVIRKPASSHLGDISGSPLHYAFYFSSDRIGALWSKARDAGVISVENVVGKVSSIMQAFGEQFYELEYSKWDQSPCNRDLSVNTAYWEIEVDENQKPVIYTEKSNYYSAETNYSVGDWCMCNAQESAGWFYKFTCVQNCLGVKPAVFGFKDSVFRLEKWLLENIANYDLINNYGG